MRSAWFSKGLDNLHFKQLTILLPKEMERE